MLFLRNHKDLINFLISQYSTHERDILVLAFDDEYSSLGLFTYFSLGVDMKIDDDRGSCLCKHAGILFRLSLSSCICMLIQFDIISMIEEIFL